MLKKLDKGLYQDFKGVGFISCFRVFRLAIMHIGKDYYFCNEGGLVISDNTFIFLGELPYTLIIMIMMEILNTSDEKKVFKPVIISKNVWIGMNVSSAQE